MLLLNQPQFSLPLDNPVLIFALILFIILFAPILLNKFKIPPIIGLIFAGALIGPYGFNLILHDSSIVLFGTVGLLYIMFLSGLDTSLSEFKKNLFKSIVFSVLTFMIPMVLGTASSYYILGFPILTSVLLASMYASNTLITYTMVSKLGITKHRIVNIAVSGTLVTTILALTVLAVIVGMTTGEVNQVFWFKISASMIVFVAVVMFLFPMITRWFFKRYDDNISQYIFILGMVYLGAFLAETAGIDKIVGAFLAGLAINTLIPKTSPLMNRIHFVGNALFIPFFLLGVGMLINYRAFFYDTETIFVALTMTVIATFSKYSAAWLTQKFFRFSKYERSLLFGLTNAQAASTLAAVMVGYSIIVGENAAGEPIRLLSESILNGTILMIIITCTIASFATQHGAQYISLREMKAVGDEKTSLSEKVLVPVNNPDTIEELINLGLTIKTNASKDELFALNIITDSQSDAVAEKKGQKNLDIAAQTAAAADYKLHELLRYDHNVVSGITNVVKEHKITDLIMGFHHKKGITDTFMGHLSEGILSKCNVTTFIYKPVQPMSTIKRQVVVVPPNAERVFGYYLWVNRVLNIAKNSGTKITFYGRKMSINTLMGFNTISDVQVDFVEFANWNNFHEIANDLKKDDILTVILSRKNHISHNPTMNRIPYLLNKFFTDNSYLLIYPVQRGLDSSVGFVTTGTTASEPGTHNMERFDELGRTLDSLFSKKKKKK